MDYNSYFMDGDFNSLEFKDEKEKDQIISKLISKFGNNYKVVSWETKYDKDNGLDITDGENMSLNDAVSLANSLVENNKVISANVWTDNNSCVYCVNWYSDEEDDDDNII